MAGHLYTACMDALLDYIDTNGADLHICSALPTTYTEATDTSSGFSLGDKQAITISTSGAGDGATGNGGGTVPRKITVSAITDGDVTKTGTAAYWAIVKTTATTDVLAAGSLASSQAVTLANTFTLTAFDIEVPIP